MIARVITVVAIAVWTVPFGTAQPAEQRSTDPPRQAAFGEDVPWSHLGPQTAVAVYGPDGEPIPFDEKVPPCIVMQLAPRFLELTPRQGLEKLEAIAELDHVFTEQAGPQVRAAELDLLAGVTVEADPGGRTFARALVHCMRALEAAGVQPAMLIYDRPVHRASMYGVICSPAVALFEVQFTPEACRQIEQDFGPWIRRNLREPDWACVYINRLGGQATAPGPLFRLLAYQLLSSGVSSHEFRRTFAELRIEEIEHKLRVGETLRYVDSTDVLRLSCCGVLSSADLSRLLAAAAPHLTALEPPTDHEGVERLRSVCRCLDTVVSLPELGPGRAATLLSLVAGVSELEERFANMFRDVRWMLLERYGIEQLYPSGVPEVVRRRFHKDKEIWSRALATGPPHKRVRAHAADFGAGAPRHIRVSTWRFTPQAPPECLGESAFEAAPGAWTIRSWGEPTCLSTVAVRLRPTATRWYLMSYNLPSGIRRTHRSEGLADRHDVKEGPVHHVLMQSITTSLRARLAEEYQATEIYVSVIELGTRPPASRLGSEELYPLLLACAEEDYRFALAAFGLLASRPEPCVRGLLMKCCQKGGGYENGNTRQAAGALLKRKDWRALDELLPDLIRRPPDDPPPLLVAFEEASQPGRAPDAKRLQWAKGIIRTQITPPMHPENVQRLLDLCRQLGAPRFQYDADDAQSKREAALRSARAWAE